jgi:Mn-dependent DtxR family transcriptional regulator
MEDYLEIISELVELKGYATTLDISRYMNVSAPSVTKMLQRLDEGGFLEYEKYHGINLTKKGTEIAEGIRQNHGILLEFFEILGVNYDTANQDTEGIEGVRNHPGYFKIHECERPKRDKDASKIG